MNSFIYEYSYTDHSKVVKALDYQMDLHFIRQCSLLKKEAQTGS